MIPTFTDYGHGFHHLRGTLSVGGVMDVGTHCALVELPDGEFVFLDSYTLPPEAEARARELTDGGRKVAAILNLHPYHTLHCEWMHRAFPKAKLYGTARHRGELPRLPWEGTLCESADFADLYAETLDLRVPDGMAMVSEDAEAHAASVLAYHPASGTIFVDDTLSRVVLPFPFARLPMAARLDFHPHIGKALLPRPRMADTFRDWAIELGIDWADARRIACAHNSTLRLPPGEFPVLIGGALGRIKPTLDRHRRRYG